MFCKYCGKPIPQANARFCPHCGQRLTDADAAGVPVAKEPGPAAPAPPAPPAPEAVPDDISQTLLNDIIASVSAEMADTPDPEPAAPAAVPPRREADRGVPSPASVPPRREADIDPSPERSGMPRAVLAALVVVVLLAVALAAWRLLGGKKGEDASLPAGTSAPADLATPAPGALGGEDGEGGDAAQPTPGADIPADGVALTGLPSQDVQLTGNGVPLTLVQADGSAWVSLSELTSLGQEIQLRAVATLPDGSHRTSMQPVLTEYLGRVDFPPVESWASCSDEGFPMEEYQLEAVIGRYYASYLNAINVQDASLLVYSTPQNTKRQAERVYAPDNAKSSWPVQDFEFSIDPDSVEYFNDTVMFNASFAAVRTIRATGEQKLISNHRTVLMVWVDGMWKVNDFPFLSDDDFAAHRYADVIGDWG